MDDCIFRSFVFRVVCSGGISVYGSLSGWECADISVGRHASGRSSGDASDQNSTTENTAAAAAAPKAEAVRKGFGRCTAALDKKTEKPQKREKKSLIFIKNPLEKYGFGSV